MAKCKCKECDGKGYLLIPENVMVARPELRCGIREVCDGNVDHILAAKSFFEYLKQVTSGVYFDELMRCFVHYDTNKNG